jgi:hypothetical protein
MELAHPLALAALAALPIIVALHLLRPRPRRVSVASTWLWREALRERHRGLGLERLLRDLSLVLLLLFALVAALALAGPSWLVPAGEAGDTVLVLDVSASMQARDGATTRFQRARAEARAVIDALAPGARLLIMSSARQPRLLSALESDREALRRALDAIEPTDEAGRPREALELALALLRSSEQGRVLFVTDGAFDPEQVPRSPRVTLVPVGGPARNVAVTRFAVRALPGEAGAFEALVGLRSDLPEALEVPLTLRLDGREPLTRRVRLAPGAVRTVVLPLQGLTGGRVRASVAVDDALAADDAAFAVLPAPQRRRVLLVGSGGFYLERALTALPDVDLVRRAQLPDEGLARAARRHDVVVLDRVAAPALPPGNWLLVDSVPPGLPFSAAGTVSSPAITGQGPSALLAGVDLAAVRVAASRRVIRSPGVPGLQRLFWSPDTDLALAWIGGPRRVVWLGFDPAQSTFPLQAAFPLFVARAVDWLSPPGSAAGGGGAPLPAGEAVRIPAPEGGADLVMRLPSGEGRTHRLEGEGLRFEDTSRAGIYAYTVNGIARHFAVNLTDPQESDLSARGLRAGTGAKAPAVGATARTPRPLWPPLATAALVLLLLEWVVWCGGRRRG